MTRFYYRGVCPGRYVPRGVFTQEVWQTPPRTRGRHPPGDRQTPVKNNLHKLRLRAQADTPPPSACWDIHPRAQCPMHAGIHTPQPSLPPVNTMGYGQQAGCMYPIGMHSCLVCQIMNCLSSSLLSASVALSNKSMMSSRPVDVFFW